MKIQVKWKASLVLDAPFEVNSEKIRTSLGHEEIYRKKRPRKERREGKARVERESKES